MSFTSGNNTYDLDSEDLWLIEFNEIAGQLWGEEYTTEEKNVHLGQFSLEEYDIFWIDNSSSDIDSFEINESGILYWYFEDGGYDFDFESPSDSDSNNVYEITINGGVLDELGSYEISIQQNLSITINDIYDTATDLEASNGYIEELSTDANDYYREFSHDVIYNWEENTKVITSYQFDVDAANNGYVNWSFASASDKKYFEIEVFGDECILKYKKLPKFFDDSISELTLKATNEHGCISEVSLGITPDKYYPVNYQGKNYSENLFGNYGDDFLTGNGGNDKLNGRVGNDILNGGKGNDQLIGRSGNDQLIGGSGNDKLIGGKGKDTAVFSAKSNVVKLFTTKKQNTRDGLDTLIGIENIDGGGGNDKLYGNIISNTLTGGTGNDLLVGGVGKDKLIGGKGKDIFKLSKGEGYDLIQDFKNKQDKIFIGSIKKLKLKNKGKDVYIYEGKDLLAKVKGAKGDLSEKGKYLV